MKTIPCQFLRIICLLLLTITVGACVQPKAVTKTPCIANNADSSYLFLQRATKATIIPIANKPGSYQLILRNPELRIICFDNKVRQLSGLITTEKFLQIWQQTIAQKAKSSTYVGGMKFVALHENKEVNYMLDLRQPKYNVKTKELSYQATVTPEQKSTLPQKSLVVTDPIILIDNFSLFCPCCVYNPDQCDQPCKVKC